MEVNFGNTRPFVVVVGGGSGVAVLPVAMSDGVTQKRGFIHGLRGLFTLTNTVMYSMS